MSFRRTNSRQFEVMILGLRKPVLGEQFEIEVRPHLKRYEVECVDLDGDRALVERLDDGPTLNGVRSRVISDKKPKIVPERSDHHRYSLDLLVELQHEDLMEDLRREEEEWREYRREHGEPGEHEDFSDDGF